MTKKLLIKWIGISIGILGGLLLITRHPILIGMEIIGAGIYFYAKKVIK